jgi:DNA-3-methyladenine glycosylase II
MAKVSYREAARILAGRDPVMARLAEAAGPPKIPPPAETNFATLVRSTSSIPIRYPPWA